MIKIYWKHLSQKLAPDNPIPGIYLLWLILIVSLRQWQVLNLWLWVSTFTSTHRSQGSLSSEQLFFFLSNILPSTLPNCYNCLSPSLLQPYSCWSRCYCSVTKSCLTLWFHRLQHASALCPPLSPRVRFYFFFGIEANLPGSPPKF